MTVPYARRDLPRPTAPDADGRDGAGLGYAKPGVDSRTAAVHAAVERKLIRL
ncbi:hypothetical protein [Micromonospora sp. NPDC007230]|uniref:hypothetical protein n=1 Tax=Micromonospora sp. NPDC007230 TaxID=3364237 RepID=UPI0036BB61EF